MSEICPKCGAKVALWAEPFTADSRHMIDGVFCLRNQLNAANAEIERLRAGFAKLRESVAGYRSELEERRVWYVSTGQRLLEQNFAGCVHAASFVLEILDSKDLTPVQPGEGE